MNRALILAAGRGVRLKPLSDTMPKPLTEVHGRPILLNALEHLEAAGVRETCIVTGHLQEKIRSACSTLCGRMEICYVQNAEFATTNNAYSLWLAREFLRGGSLLIEADIFFDPAVLERLLQQSGSAWAADDFTHAMNGCRLRTDGTGRIVELEIVKRADSVPPNRYKSAGLLKIEHALAERFVGWLEQEVGEDRNLFFDLVLGRHLDEAAIRVCRVNGLRWAEIDDIHDLAEAEKLFGETNCRQ